MFKSKKMFCVSVKGSEIPSDELDMMTKAIEANKSLNISAEIGKDNSSTYKVYALNSYQINFLCDLLREEGAELLSKYLKRKKDEKLNLQNYIR